MKSGIILFPLILGLKPLSQGQTMRFADLAPTYTGAPLWPRVLLDGQPRTAAFKCRQLDLNATQTVFSNLPTPLGLSYQSLGFSATKTSALGNMVRLAGTARVADHAEVVMVTWATAAKYPDLAASDASGYNHPVTATIYQLIASSGSIPSLLKLDESTVQVRIPWRPITLPDGKPYPYNGYAFGAVIPFSANVTLPNECLISISFNTQATGDTPLGVAGPYDQLNLALGTAAPKIGTDVNGDEVFWKSNGQWFYPATSWGGYGSPMLGLRTRVVSLAQPALTSVTPLHAGTYHLEATVNPERVAAAAILTLLKAQATLSAGGLEKPVDDPLRGVQVSTFPTGLATETTYNGSSVPSEIPGTYPFTINVTNPDYSGSLSGIYHLTARSYDGWSEQYFAGAPPDLATPDADPDSDGLPNWMEYAMGSDPLKLEQGPGIAWQDGSIRFIFTQRREMKGFRLTPEFSDDLRVWRTIGSTTITTGDWLETKSVNCPPGHGGIRLRCDRD